MFKFQRYIEKVSLKLHFAHTLTLILPLTGNSENTILKEQIKTREKDSKTFLLFPRTFTLEIKSIIKKY